MDSTGSQGIFRPIVGSWRPCSTYCCVRAKPRRIYGCVRASTWGPRASLPTGRGWKKRGSRPPSRPPATCRAWRDASVKALVRLEGVGPFLCHAGIATIEKAYRRSHHLFARESDAARFSGLEIEGDRARIHFEPSGAADRTRAGRGGAVFCEMRLGMLEALPMVFGLLPAKVRETACAHRGADACTFEASWSRQSRKGLFSGLTVGLVATAAAGAWSWFGGPPLVPVLAIGFTGSLLTALAGRSFDLSRQLEAVAGARRGQLALLDQVDRSLAEKLDELAKVGASPAHTPMRSSAPVVESGEGLVPVSRHAGGAASEAPPASSASHERLSLREVLERAWSGVSRTRAEASQVALDLADEAVDVMGDAMQLEFMIEQLLLNALDASEGAQGVRIGVARSGLGVELVVEDGGPGIEPEMLDEAFDPFFEGTPDGAGGGLGLPICYRIVAEHGGQLHVESRADEGTRVRVHLPNATSV